LEPPAPRASAFRGEKDYWPHHFEPSVVVGV
jgi:hypothetical protein